MTTKKPNFARKAPEVPPIKSNKQMWALVDECKTEAAFQKLQPRMIAWIYESWLAPGNQEWAESITRRMWENPTCIWWGRDKDPPGP